MIAHHKQRVYLSEIVEYCIQGKGWSSKAVWERDDILQVSLKYYDIIGSVIVSEGTEDFSIDRYNKMQQDTKLQYTDVKIFHKSPKRHWKINKQTYRTIRTIVTHSNATKSQIQLVISAICNTRYDLLKTITI